MTTLGTIAEIWRYPVKSMAGERLDRCAIGLRGLFGDRGWAVRDEHTGRLGSAKQIPELLMCSARYLCDPDGVTIPHAEIRLADGTVFTTADRDADARVSAFLGRAATLHRLGPPPDAHFDDAPIHLLTTASLDALSAMIPGAQIAPRRFRANVIIRTPGTLRGFAEFAWTGAAIRIGSSLLTGGEPVPRCGMVSASQPGLAKDPSILRAIVEGIDRYLGIYASTANAAEVQVGDTVALVG